MQEELMRDPVEALESVDLHVFPVVQVVKKALVLLQQEQESIPSLYAKSVVSPASSSVHASIAKAAMLSQVEKMLCHEELLLDAPIDGILQPIKTTFESSQREVITLAMTALWKRVIVAQLQLALTRLVHEIEFIPHAIGFWKRQKKRHLKARIERGPFEWFLPRDQRRSADDRIALLQQTLDVQLRKIGHLKRLITKCTSSTASTTAAQQDTAMIVNEAYALLAQVYNVMPNYHYAVTESSNAFHEDRGPVDIPTTVTFGYELPEYVMADLRLVRTKLQETAQAQRLFEMDFRRHVHGARVPSKMRQKWLQVSLVMLGVFSGSIWILKHQKEFSDALHTFMQSLREFFSQHTIAPMEAIVKEVILNETTAIQDAAALEDTKQSLQRMLAEFVRDTKPKATSEELRAIMERMDMSVVSLQYEQELSHSVRNLLTGDLVRMMLIQVQFIKKELMVAMGAIDRLMHANQLNLQMLATIPTFVVVGGMYSFLRRIVDYVVRRTSEQLYYDPTQVATLLRTHLRDIERLLNMQNRPLDATAGASASHNDHALNDRDLGHLVLLLHQVQQLFESQRQLIDEDEEEQERFEEDLKDLVQEGLLVAQQVAVIQRMFHSHPFLQRTKQKTRWLLG